MKISKLRFIWLSIFNVKKLRLLIQQHVNSEVNKVEKNLTEEFTERLQYLKHEQGYKSIISNPSNIIQKYVLNVPIYGRDKVNNFQFNPSRQVNYDCKEYNVDKIQTSYFHPTNTLSFVKNEAAFEITNF